MRKTKMLLAFLCLLAGVVFAAPQVLAETANDYEATEENAADDYEITESTEQIPEKTEAPEPDTQTAKEKFADLGMELLENNKINLTVLAICLSVLAVLSIQKTNWKNRG